MVTITRRQLMLSSAAAGTATLAAGGAWIIAGGHEAFYAGLVGHALKSEPLAPGALEAFAAEYLDIGEDQAKVEVLVQIERVAGFAGLDAIFSGNRAFEHFKRRVVTKFMLSSTFFQRASRDEPIAFTGLSAACSNPFARFD